MNYGFVIDGRKCIGCHACTVACKSENQVPLGVNRTWVKYVEKGSFPDTRRYFTVLRCNHCEDPPCVDICPVEALHKRDDGIVDFDSRRCIGCKACAQACPYNAVYIDPESGTTAKCSYCSHRVEIGMKPACAVICPQQAIVSGDLDDPHSEISALLAKERTVVRKPEKGTSPNVFYINGDGASLDPLQASESDLYMWSAQSRGVGHFAKHAIEGGHYHAPESAAEHHGEKKPAATARRVYDAPSKGSVWGWEVPAYVWSKAVSAGAFLMLFAFSLLPGMMLPEPMQWALWAVALLFLSLTGGFLVKDLDRPDRFTSVMLRPQFSSWLVRGGLTIAGYGAFLALWAAGMYLKLPLLVTVGLWGGAALAFLTAVYTAFLFGSAKGRDFWQSPMLSLHMLLNSVIAGGSAMAVLSSVIALDPASASLLRVTLGVAFLLHLLVMWAELFGRHPSLNAERSAEAITGGSLKGQFWLGSVVVGNLLPLLVVILSASSLLIGVASIGAMIGVFYTEKVWVQAPQSISLS